MSALTQDELAEILEWERGCCSCHLSAPCSHCESTEIVQCRECGAEGKAHVKSAVARGIFNYFCNENCEDNYSLKL